jgi:hypothetical protein
MFVLPEIMSAIQEADRRRDEAFRNLCESFEQNDPQSTEFNESTFRGLVGYGRRLGEALRNNSNVSNLSLDVSNFFARDEVNTKSAAPLILFIRNSASVREVGVTSLGSFGVQPTRLVSALVDQIWNAVAENLCITTVQSRCATESFVSLPNVMQTSQSIKKLSVSMVDTRTEDFDGTQLAEAIRDNSALEDVCISSRCLRAMDGRDDGWAVGMLSALESHTRLRRLCVVGSTSAPMANATGSVLRSTTSLIRLELSFIFDRESMRGILDGLRANQTVSLLKFDANARFEEEAVSGQ